jgi:anti-sigma factor RsiW
MDRQMCNQLVDYFNEQLNEVEKKAFEKHLETCEECTTELAEWQALTDDLPYVSASINPPEGMKARILKTVFEEELEKETTPVKPIVTSEKVIPIKKNRSFTWLPAIAAALMLSVGANIFLASIVKNQQDEVAMSGVNSAFFFRLLRAATLEGAYADPIYNGNNNMDGWRMKEFPGHQAAYINVIESDTFQKIEPKSLGSMH